MALDVSGGAAVLADTCEIGAIFPLATAADERQHHHQCDQEKGHHANTDTDDGFNRQHLQLKNSNNKLFFNSTEFPQSSPAVQDGEPHPNYSIFMLSLKIDVWIHPDHLTSSWPSFPSKIVICVQVWLKKKEKSALA